MTKKYHSRQDALTKLRNYCVYQERCHKEVYAKLVELGIYGDDLGNIITELIADNYLNEERYAIAFAGGRFRVKKWGKNRIVQELKQNNISAYCIKKAIETQLPFEDYMQTLREVLEKKDGLLHESNFSKRKNKLAQYAVSKGFESHLVWEVLADWGKK